jgi:hypothetical protein
VVQFWASSYRPVDGARIGIAVGSLDQKDATADRSGTVSGITILDLNRELNATSFGFFWGLILLAARFSPMKNIPPHKFGIEGSPSKKLIFSLHILF